MFSIGVILQEIVLMIQGVEAMEFKPFLYANPILFFLAIINGNWFDFDHHKLE